MLPGLVQKRARFCAFFDREADVSTPLAQKTWQTGFLDPSKFRFCSRFSLHGVHCMFTTLHSAGISRGGKPLAWQTQFSFGRKPRCGMPLHTDMSLPTVANSPGKLANSFCGRAYCLPLSVLLGRRLMEVLSIEPRLW
jgi:hypothetical protein